MTALFLFDISSPYAYLAASRVDDVLPSRPEWRPVAFGVIVRETGKVPWSFAPDRQDNLDEIARRARAYGLPEVRYPPGWPVESYSLLPLRALTLATNQDGLRAMARGFYRTMFAQGTPLAELDAVRASLDEAGLDGETIVARIDGLEAKQRLRENTADALRRGVTGVPTTIVGGQRFWGDDQLDAAAAAIRAADS